MRVNQAIAALAATGILIAGILLYNQPENLAPESGLGLDATASAPFQARHIREAQMAPPEQQGVVPAAATARNPASAPVPATARGTRFRKSFKSPLSVLETLLTNDMPAASDGSHLRTQIVRTHFKYPLVRIEAQVSPSGDLIAEREMVADHVLVQLQAGATRQDLEEVLAHQTGFTAYVRYAAHTPGLFLVAFDGTDLRAMERVILSLTSERHVIARSEPDLIVHAF
jgi:hypothetical protein